MNLPQNFPIPQTPADVITLDIGGGLSHNELYNLIIHPEAEDWLNKAGTFGASDGSAKLTLKLRLSNNWVLKTNSNNCSIVLDNVINRLSQEVNHAHKLKIWHPSKTWFIIQQKNIYWPCTATKKLTTLRDVNSKEEKIRYWGQMILLSYQIFRSYHLGLDINPSNFGFDDDKDQLFYLDDEIYLTSDLKDIGEAIVHRIPQEADFTVEDWLSFGTEIGKILKPLLGNPYNWTRLIAAMGDYPLTTTFVKQRESLINGFLNNQPVKETNVPTRKICIMADIHSNLEALLAVLNVVKTLNVDEYYILGDIVGYGANPRECLEIVGNLPNATIIRGNHDDNIATGIFEEGINRLARESAIWTRQVLTEEHLNWLINLPIEQVYDNWMMLHGAPQDPYRFYGYIYEMTYKSNLKHMTEKGLNVVFHGHNHIQFIYQLNEDNTFEKFLPTQYKPFQKGKYVLINPGSVGQPRDGDPLAAFAIWDQAKSTIDFHRVEYPIQKTMRTILDAGLPDMLATRLEVGR